MGMNVSRIDLKERKTNDGITKIIRCKQWNLSLIHIFIVAASYYLLKALDLKLALGYKMYLAYKIEKCKVNILKKMELVDYDM